MLWVEPGPCGPSIEVFADQPNMCAAEDHSGMSNFGRDSMHCLFCGCDVMPSLLCTLQKNISVVFQVYAPNVIL
jgi:hypothetical protein